MDSNTHSTSSPAGLGALAAAVDHLATHDLDSLTDTALVERALELRGLGDRIDGQWLRTLAAVDARGAAGAEDGVPAGSTAGWLRRRLRMSAAPPPAWSAPPAPWRQVRRARLDGRGA
jgi:hypothetical protein